MATQKKAKKYKRTPLILVGHVCEEAENMETKEHVGWSVWLYSGDEKRWYHHSVCIDHMRAKEILDAEVRRSGNGYAAGAIIDQRIPPIPYEW